MPSFAWTCQICDARNDADYESCVHCGAGSKLTADEIAVGREIYSKQGGRKFVCPKCNGEEYVYGEVRASGGSASGLFEVSNRRFMCVSCKRCGFCEFYRMDGSMAYNIMDFLIS